MKFSLNTLHKFVSLQEWSVNDIAEKLNLKGIEVEGVQIQQWNHIIVGQIIHQRPHPNADRLKICDVQVSEKQPYLSIICGAQNQQMGDKVVVCLDGACLPCGMKIKKRKIRGEWSEGMLASKTEMGEKSEDEGIWILPSSAVVGQRLDEYLHIKDSYLDIAVAPNRPDLLSHIGLARELSGIFNKNIKLDHVFWPISYKSKQHLLGVSPSRIQSSQSSSLEPQISKKAFSKKVKIAELDLCPFYQYQVILNVCVQESPLWLKNRLEFLGLKSINNIVDATNWVLLEWGQPLHAFDLDVLEGDLNIRKASAQTQLDTLDDRCITFSGDELVICDDQKTLALAGVIGGKNSSIQTSTQNILIESAVFAPYAVRCSARKFGFNTLSAFHFSRGVFPQTTELALERVCQLIQQTAGGEIVLNKENPMPSLPQTEIEINEKDLSDRLGYSVSMSELSTCMQSMHIEVQKERSKTILKPPYYRTDLNIKEDVIEEWARLKGYDFVPESLPVLSFRKTLSNSFLDFLDFIQKIVKEQACYQAINYSFINDLFQKHFLGHQGFFEKKQPILIQKPISQDWNSLRWSMLPGLFTNFLTNMKHGCEKGRLFEQGVNFSKTNSKDIFEKTDLAFIFWGQEKSLWQSRMPRSVFFDLKSVVESILKRIGVPSWEWQFLKEDYPFLHPKAKIALIIKRQVIGFMGLIHPVLQEKNKIRETAVMGEFSLDLLSALPKQPFSFQKLSDLPIVHRDLSFVIDQSQPVNEVFQCIQKEAPSFCRNISIIDYYEGKGLKKSQRSVTFRLSLQGSEKTLSERQINQYTTRIEEMLFKKLSVQIR